MQFLEVNGPQLFAGVYLDAENRLASSVQVHRDSESMSAWQVADPYIPDVMQHITPTRVEIFGEPSEPVLQGMRRLTGNGASLVIKPRVAGFSRL